MSHSSSLPPKMRLIDMENFEIPDPVMPSPEARYAFAKQQIETYRRYMLDEIYPSVPDVIVPATFITLTPDEALKFKDVLTRSERPETLSDTAIAADPFLSHLSRRITDAITSYNTPCFVRLNSRSPKDGFNDRYDNMRQRPNTNGNEALRCFAASERIYTDLLDANPVKSPVSIAVRPYLLDLKNENEFRTFIENSKIVGMCRMYQKDTHATWHKTHFTQLDDALRTLASYTITQLPNLPNMTLDVIAKPSENTPGQIDTQLLEINPPLSLGCVDPLYFTKNPTDGHLHI